MKPTAILHFTFCSFINNGYNTPYGRIINTSAESVKKLHEVIERICKEKTESFTLSLRGGRRPTRQSKAMKHYWLYIMTNTNNTVLYAGVTNNLERRVTEHKDKKGSSFTSKYNVTKLVFYERFDRIYDAIAAEKKIKAGSRAKKIEIIETMNPNWQDLYNTNYV